MASIFDRIAGASSRLAHAYNAFRGEDEAIETRTFQEFGASYGLRPDRRVLSSSNDRSIIASVITRIAMDSAGIDIRHVQLDEDGRYKEDLDSGLNNCLTVEANIDQGARAFKQDYYTIMLEKGVVAIVPVDTTDDPMVTGSYDINTLRAGEIVQWYARHVRVKLWDDRKGRFSEVTVAKSNVAIVENPLYNVMNAPNSTLQRLIRKLNMLDAVDEASSSGKLDLIIQLPYVIKSDARRREAENRAKDIEMQLKGTKYGIAYTDGTENITQLNRPAENNMLAQVQYLTNMLFGQLGLTESVFDGTADEKAMLNYINRTVKPILQSTVEGMKRSFLTKTARTQGKSVMYFRNPFDLVAVSDIADIADKFSRNEILTPNEIRGIIGFKPDSSAKSDQLINSNMPQKALDAPTPVNPIDPTQPRSIGELAVQKALKPNQQIDPTKVVRGDRQNDSKPVRS